MTAPRYERGTPVRATGAVAQRIIERVAKLSKQYGTTVELVGGAGHVQIGERRRSRGRAAASKSGAPRPSPHRP
jgi:hypothetical protein